MSAAGDAVNTAANLAEHRLGEQPGVPTSHIANPSNDGQRPHLFYLKCLSTHASCSAEKFADPSGEKMKALAWFGKNDVRMVEANKPKIVDPTDVVLKVTGSTICGSFSLLSKDFSR